MKRSPEKAEEEEEPATSAKRVRLETAPPPASAPSPAKTGPEPEVKPSQSLSPRSSDAPNFIFGQNLAERADNFATGFVFGQNLTERAANFSPEPAADETEPAVSASSSPDKLIAQANAACHRLERALGRIKSLDATPKALPELIALRDRVEAITQRWLQGSDCQTPSQAER